MYSSSASQVASSMAPMVSTMGMPSRTLPTSLSSNLPSKMRSFMSATLAMVVPSLKLLASITLLPSFTGTSSTMPLMVLRTRVRVAPLLLRATPSRTMSRLSSAPRSSSWAFSSAIW